MTTEPVSIQHTSVTMDEIMRHFVLGYPGVVKHEWAFNPTTGKVIFELFVRDERSGNGFIRNDLKL